MKKIYFLLLAILFINISFAQKSIPNITLQNLENTPVKIASFTENKLIILSFWATWCIPCINELNAINEVYENWQEETNVQLIAVSIDDNRTISRVRPLINSNESIVFPLYGPSNITFKSTFIDSFGVILT